MADPWTTAWEEAEASAPPGVEIYSTLELQHPAFVDDGTPFAVRVVAGTTSDINLTLEVGAVLNGGETVTFNAVTFQADRPKFEQGQTPSVDVIIDGVSKDLQPYLEQAVNMRADLVMIYREYRNDDTTSPCYGPVQFVIRKVNVSLTRIRGTAYIDDLANRKFPNQIYSIFDFPALRS